MAVLYTAVDLKLILGKAFVLSVGDLLQDGPEITGRFHRFCSTDQVGR